MQDPERHELADLDPGLDFVSPRLADLKAYWDAKRGARRMPAPGEIDPVEMAAHLGHICLIDVLQAPLRFRWRLMGSSVVDAVGQDATGQFFDEAEYTEVFQGLAASCRWVVRERAPLRTVGTVPYADIGRMGCESVALPLADDGETVAQILSEMIFARAG